ncbi:hypothetical protein BDV12DRAFT_178047 [Aspergillus spectabilis]
MPTAGQDPQSSCRSLTDENTTPFIHDTAAIDHELPPSEARYGDTNGYTDDDEGGNQSPLTGTKALLKILERGQWDKFGFVLFRTFYGNDALWLRFVEEYEPLLRAEITSADPSLETHNISDKVKIDIVSDDCMDNKIPAHIAMVYRMFSDIEPGLKTKMCLVADRECMESVTTKGSSSVPFVKAVDVILGADAESAFPRVIKVAVSSLLARFYPALANCDTVWEIVSDGDDIWTDWPGLADGVE